MTDTTDTTASEPPEKKVNPWVRSLFEYGPIIAFFVGYMIVRDMSFTVAGREYQGFIAVTAGFIPLQALATFFMWRLTGKISGIQIATVVLVVVMGGISIWLNDERFIKMKPTILYVLFAGILGWGLLRGKSYIKVVMDETVPMTHEGWMILTRRLAVFFAVLAVANEAIWRTMSTDMWVNFKTFGLPLSIFAFFIAQSKIFAEHSTEDTENDA